MSRSDLGGFILSSGKEPEAYVRKIQEDTRRYVESLLKETERLRVLVRRMERDKEQLCREVDALRGRLHRQEESQSKLQRELEDIQKASERSAEDFATVEQQHNDLATLYIASYRLHGTLNRAEVLATIKEIITNLVGSEQVAVFECSEDRRSLELVASTGVDAELYGTVDLENHVIGRIAGQGQLYLEGSGHAYDEEGKSLGLNACIPMKIDGRLVGAVAVFRLLQQKSGWAEVDHQLFELLGTQAAIALFCTRLVADRI